MTQSNVFIALLGLATAIFTNTAEIESFYTKIVKKPAVLDGKWTGVFKEYWSQDSKEHISHEFMNLDFRSNNLVGTSYTTTGKARNWRVLGQKDIAGRKEFIILTYVTEDKDRSSAGAYFLKYKESENSYFGYRLGYDHEKSQMVAFPYVLTRLDAVDAESQYREYLNTTVPSRIDPCLTDNCNGLADASR